MNVYYALVPDKNYFLPASGNHLVMDYDRLRDVVCAGMDDMTYIDLYGALSLADYYNTDGHWRQERLWNVVAALGQGMGHEFAFDPAAYEAQSFDSFYGAYYGQSARLLTPDTLTWLENDITRNAKVSLVDDKGYLQPSQMYNTADLTGIDAYDIYLHGMQPLIVLENPSAETGRELILFRDSYGSSLAPVLLEHYAKITVVDLRYILPDVLPAYIQFGDQEVLFLYSTIVANQSDMVREFLVP